MPCYDVIYDDLPRRSDDWLAQTQSMLSAHWFKTTGHKPGATTSAWACRNCSQLPRLQRTPEFTLLFARRGERGGDISRQDLL